MEHTISKESVLMLYRWLSMSNKNKKKVMEQYRALEETPLKKTSVLVDAMNEYTKKNEKEIIEKAIEYEIADRN